MKLANLVVVAFCTMLAHPAQCLTGADLYRFCTNPSGSAKDQVCLAYIRGVAEGLALADVYKTKVTLCVDRLNLDDPVVTRLIVEKYMRDNPTQLAREAALTVVLALLAECDKWDNLPPTESPEDKK